MTFRTLKKVKREENNTLELDMGVVAPSSLWLKEEHETLTGC